MGKKRRKIIVFALALGLACYVHANKRVLVDGYVVWRNPPSPAVVDLAERTGMSDLGRRVFFASLPSIDDAEDFSASCSDIETTMIILGCHVNGKIHVFNVRDERIAAAKYVTAAHEMLHAAYMRLSATERARVDGMLEDMYRSSGDSEEFSAVMAEYAQVEPGQRDNELHSILGTEYTTLSPELEDYYSRYFSDRRRVADMTIQYKKVFKNLEAGQVKLKAQLERLAAKIESDSSLFETMAFQLNADIDAFNQREFHSSVTFNAARQALIGRQLEIEKFKAQINTDIAKYDAWVEEYNNLGGRINQLNRLLDAKSQVGIRAIEGAGGS
jgi:hypothetical protein